MSDNQDTAKSHDAIDRYKYLPGLLHHIRWVQRFAAILAEALILLAFLASGMDVSMGGILANIPVVKWAWATIFSLGVDTSFVVSWVRCRELGRSWHLLWSVPVALGISFVVFEPVVIQLLQQALNIEFSEALRELGINLTLLVYARAGVAVFLGAILALTNVESNTAKPPKPARPQRKFILFEQVMSKLTLVVRKQVPQPVHTQANDEPPAQLPAPSEQQPVSEEVPPSGYEDISDQPTVDLPVPVEQPVAHIETTLQEREEKVRKLDMTDLRAAERVATVAALFPNIPDRELGRLSGVSAATAKKYRSQPSGLLQHTSTVDTDAGQ